MGDFFAFQVALGVGEALRGALVQDGTLPSERAQQAGGGERNIADDFGFHPEAILAGEEAVQMRLLAMDYLATSGLSSERFDEVFDELVRRDDQALLVRAARYDLDRHGDDR